MSTPAVRTIPRTSRNVLAPDLCTIDREIAWIRDAEQDVLLPPERAVVPDTPELTSRWVSFAKSTAYPRDAVQAEKLVTPEWLNQNLGDYSRPWLANQADEDEDDENRYQAFQRKRSVWWKRSQHTILRNPMIPLVFRLVVFTFSLAALILGANLREGDAPGPSALMAVIFDTVAMLYIIYVTWDEYTGKPLGLRSARTKIRLIFLDLFFIVFDSANMALAFESLTDDNGPCVNSNVNGNNSPVDKKTCHKQSGLAAVLLVALFAWLMTFAVSVLRYACLSYV